MSTTSGPIVPWRTGKVTLGEPSEKLRVAVRSVMMSAPSRAHSRAGFGTLHCHSLGPIETAVGSLLDAAGTAFNQTASNETKTKLSRAQLRDHGREPGIGRLRAARDQIPQLIVGQVEQPVE